MSIVQWLLLILLIAVVGGAYWYMRRQAGDDPWRGMDDTPRGAGEDSPDTGEHGRSTVRRSMECWTWRRWQHV